MTNTQYELKHIEKLVGGDITGLLDAGESYGFTVRQKTKTGWKTYRVFVDRDPEGNGPGHLAIEEEK